MGIAVDGAGNALVTGHTGCSASGNEHVPWDVLVAKVNPFGGIDWVTYLGGEYYDDSGYDIAVDSAGNVLVTGGTYHASEFAHGGCGGGADAFVAKLSPSGGTAWVTVFGGSGDDSGSGIAVDRAGNALVTGSTASPGWASGAFSSHVYNYSDAFVAKISPGGRLAWATYLGGDRPDYSNGIALDRAGNALITGTTRSGWPGGDLGWASGAYGGGPSDAFVAKFSPNGGLAWATFLGGSDIDHGNRIAVDGAGNALVAGTVDFGVFSDADKSAFVAKISEPPAKWTVMVFADADNDLEEYSLWDLDRMEDVDLSQVPVNIVVQLDRSARYYNDTVPSAYVTDGDWSDTRRAVVRYDGIGGTYSTWFAPADFAAPEVDMGDDQALVDFIQWAMTVAPADHYALVLDDHGGGWQGLLQDSDPAPRHVMSLSQLRVALDAVPHLDVVAMNMCLMQMVEVATELIGEADYLVASEDIMSPGDINYAGWRNDGWLTWLEQHPDALPYDLAMAIFNENLGATLSVLDLSRVPDLVSSIADFSEVALTSATAWDWERLKDARRQADRFFIWSYRDLFQYMNAVAADSQISTDIRNAAQAVVAQVGQAVVGTKGRGAGISIYLPAGGRSVEAKYTGSNLTFCYPAQPNGTRWGEFVRRLPDTDWVDPWDADWGETISHARRVEGAAGQMIGIQSAIELPSDVDFMRFTGSAGQVLSAELSGDATAGGLEPVLTLFAPDGTSVVAQVLGDAEGKARLDRQPLAVDGEYYLAVTSAGNLDPLDPSDGTSIGTYRMTLIYDEPGAFEPAIGLSATSVDFGMVEAFNWAQATIEVTNTGGDTLEITEITLPDGSPFAAPWAKVLLPFTLPPGESVDLVVGAKPAGEGAALATCSILSNAPLTPQINVDLHVEGIDTTAPSVIEFYVNEGLPIDEPITRLNLRFNEDVSATLDVSDLRLENASTGEQVDPAVMATAYRPDDNVATWTFPGLAGESLPEGEYALTLSGTGVTDAAGHLLDGDSNGIAGGDYTARILTGHFVLGCHIFYNNSAFDGNDVEANAQDDFAVAVDKKALLPGETATFANYTSYDKGINGIMVDIVGAGVPTVNDFAFRVVNDGDPASWDAAPEPVGVTTRPIVDNLQRVTLIWEDHTVENCWLEVTVKDTGSTGLHVPSVFYFGNTPGESGDSAVDTRVNAVDMLITRNNPHNLLDPANVDSPCDFNRDQRVNAFDMLLVRNSQTHLLNALPLIAVDVSVGIDDVTVMEGDSGTTNAVFTVGLSAPSSRIVEISYRTEDGVARAGADYEATAGTLTFQPGETRKLINVPIIGDTVFESDEWLMVDSESFQVLLAAPLDGPIAEGIGYIKDDDPVPEIALVEAAVTVLEGDFGTSTVEVVFDILEEREGTFVVDVWGEDGSATSGSDYALFGMGFGFVTPDMPSLSVFVNIVGDTVPESDETLFINLLSSRQTLQGSVTIINDDTELQLSTSSARENAVDICLGSEYLYPEDGSAALIKDGDAVLDWLYDFDLLDDTQTRGKASGDGAVDELIGNLSILDAT